MQTSSHFPEALIAPQLHTFLKQPESSEQQSTKQGEAKRVPFAADRGTYEKQNVFGVNCTVAHWYASWIWTVPKPPSTLGDDDATTICSHISRSCELELAHLSLTVLRVPASFDCRGPSQCLQGQHHWQRALYTTCRHLFFTTKGNAEDDGQRDSNKHEIPASCNTTNPRATADVQVQAEFGTLSSIPHKHNAIKIFVNRGCSRSMNEVWNLLELACVLCTV